MTLHSDLLITSLILTVFFMKVSPKVNTITALKYLYRFGYLDPQILNPEYYDFMSEEKIEEAIMELQAFAGLSITGELDNYTLRLMQLPRCGVKDQIDFASDSRRKRYAHQGSRWKVKNLTYKISKYPRDLSKEDVDEEIQKAFDIWADVTPLKFTKKKWGSAHIEVKFESGKHGDNDPFDGPGGTLVHANTPTFGDVHFDDAEKWTINSYRGTNLQQVASHAFGHSLGLSHSDIRSAMMAPFYKRYDPSFELDEDDVKGIHAIYGRKVIRIDRDTPAGKHYKVLCSGSGIDTIFNSADGITYVFKGMNYWRLTDGATVVGYPQLISKTWPGLPGNINAAFTYKNGKTYFFKDNHYWKYIDYKMDGRYPKKISEGFAGAPDNIDAAMVWGGNEKIYFFKGSKFWKFNPEEYPHILNSYPKPISNWKGIPDNLNAAFQDTNGYTYFFKNEKYYRFNDDSFSVDTAYPPYPRPAGYWWFGCKEEPDYF